MKNRIVFAFLLITLAACTPAQPTLTGAQNTLVAAVTTADALTQAARFPSPPPTVAIVTPSPLPTQPVFPVITPDTIQVERWQEYQTELAKLVLAQHPSQETPFDETALCEWDILGRTDKKVYVWAMCGTPNSGGRKPAVIHLGSDGSIQKVEVPFHAAWESTIQNLFPVDVQEKIDAYFDSSSSNSGRAEELRMHLLYRRLHMGEPPLTILSAMPTPTPTP